MIDLLKLIKKRDIYGVMLDIDEIYQRYKINNINDIDSVSFYHGGERYLRWNDIRSALYNTDNLSASVIPSFFIGIPTIFLSQSPVKENINEYLSTQINRQVKTFIILEKKQDRCYNKLSAREKYYKYWSKKIKGMKIFGDITVNTYTSEKYDDINIVYVSMINNTTGQINYSKIIHYLNWLNDDDIDIKSLNYLVEESKNDIINNDEFLLIHCSQGTMKSGTLAAAIIMGGLQEVNLKNITVDELILYIRICRPPVILTKYQRDLLIKYREQLLS